MLARTLQIISCIDQFFNVYYYVVQFALYMKLQKPNKNSKQMEFICYHILNKMRSEFLLGLCYVIYNYFVIV